MKLAESVNSLLQIGAVSEYTHIIHQCLLHILPDGVNIFPALFARNEVIYALLLFFGKALNQAVLIVQFSSLGVLSHLFAHHPTADDGFGQRISSQAVKAVKIPAGGLAHREQPFEAVCIAVLVCPYPSHAVVLGGPHRNKAVYRVNSVEILAYIGYLT